MEFDIKKIRTLCEKYFDGETSAEEEMMLRAYFNYSENIPADLKAVKVMFCGMEEASRMTYTPAAPRTGKRLFSRIIWGSVAAAASVAICISLFNREIYGYDADGKAITDPQVALKGTECLAMLDRLETTIDIAQLLTQEMENNN